MPFLLYILLTSVCFANVPSSAIRTTDIKDICTTKTDTIRDVSLVKRKLAYRLAGIPGNFKGICNGPRGCEVDHRVPLWLGGSNDISNLMVKPYFGSCNMMQKDVLEVKLHKLVCKNELEVSKAQTLIYDDWEEAYKLYVNSNGCN